MSKEELDEELTQLTRRGLFLKGGVAAAGLTVLGTPVGAAYAAGRASSFKMAVVTHGDTGSFWSVFKKGVDQAKKDLNVNVTQVYADNNVPKQVAGINAAIAGGAKVIATSVPDASALKDPLSKASKKGIEVITVNSGLGAFDSLSTYEVHVGQTEDIAGQGADDPGRQEGHPGDEGQGQSGLRRRQEARLVPRPRPGRHDPVPRRHPQGHEGRHVRRRRLDQGDPRRQDAVRDRPAAVSAGLPAGRLRLSVREQPEHGRERPTGPDRPGNHQQGERGQGGSARSEGHSLARGGGWAAARVAHPAGSEETRMAETAA